MALFGKKKSESEASGAPEGEGASVQAQPDKARSFFDYAKARQETGQYEYAMTLWMRGLALDPTDMNALEAFFASCAAFLGESGGKPKLSKETKNAVTSNTPAAKFVQSCLAYAMKPTDPGAAISAVLLASKADLAEAAHYLGVRAIALVGSEAKPKKSSAVDLLDALEAVGAYDLAEKAGNIAIAADPGDSPLQARVRNMSAQATMTQGGFDETGQEGGFRKNLRNADAQRQLEEEQRVVKSGSVKDRLVEDVRSELKERPDDLPTREKFIKALRERGNPDDLKTAGALAKKTYEESREFKFRQMAGEIRIKMARSQVQKYRVAAEKGGEAEKASYAKAQQKFLAMEAEELRLQVEAYPTDRGAKYELGVRETKLGNHEAAIALFQQSKDDAKHRSGSLMHLGLCFAAIGLNDEAIQTLREALSKHENASDEQGMELRYTLMESLLAKSEQDKDLAAAEEADKLSSAIVMEQITYRDVRAKRDQIKSILQQLRG